MAEEQERLPWERQKGESRKSYEAFSIYRDLGTKRSLKKVSTKLDKSMTLIGRWSSKWNWIKRAEDYDEEEDRQYRLEMEEKRKEMRKRHANEAKLFQQKIYERIQSMKPTELKPSDLSRWLDVAVKVERLALGESTEIAEVEHGGEVTKRHEYDITHRVEQYEDVYTQMLQREAIATDSENEGGNAGDDS